MILASLKSGRDIEQLQTIRTIIEKESLPISSKKGRIKYIEHNKQRIKLMSANSKSRLDQTDLSTARGIIRNGISRNG